MENTKQELTPFKSMKEAAFFARIGELPLDTVKYISRQFKLKFRKYALHFTIPMKYKINEAKQSVDIHCKIYGQHIHVVSICKDKELYIPIVGMCLAKYRLLMQLRNQVNLKPQWRSIEHPKKQKKAKKKAF